MGRERERGDHARGGKRGKTRDEMTGGKKESR